MGYQNCFKKQRVNVTSIEDIQFITKDGYVIFDFETTGLDRKTDKIIEIGAALVENGKIVKQYHTMVNPHMRIPTEAKRINHISDADVAAAPDIQQVLPSFLDFIRGHIVGAHYAVFDVSFLDEANGGLPDGFEFFDTIDCAKAAFPQYGSYKLQNLVEYLNLPCDNSHRADSDVRSTVALVERCRTGNAANRPTSTSTEKNTTNSKYPPKNRGIAIILCLLFGYMGIHRFYLGKIGTGILWLLTCGMFGIGWFVDFITCCTGGIYPNWEQ